MSEKPAAIDVTTNPLYKEPDKFKGVTSEFQKGWKYYIGVVELGAASSKTYPLLLPICEDRNLGHYVLVIEDTDKEALGGPNGPLSDRQVLVQYNPMAQDDDSAIEKFVAEYNYIISKPDFYSDELLSDVPELYDEEEAMQNFSRFVDGLAYEYRKESGFVLSAIVQSEYEMLSKDNGDWITRAYWTHPHDYIKRKIGKPFDILDHNIASVVYDDY